MLGMREALLDKDVAADNIHYEVFGPDSWAAAPEVAKIIAAVRRKLRHRPRRSCGPGRNSTRSAVPTTTRRLGQRDVGALTLIGLLVFRVLNRIGRVRSGPRR